MSSAHITVLASASCTRTRRRPGSGPVGRRQVGDLVPGIAHRVVLGTLEDAGQVADQDHGPAGVLVVAAGEPVPGQHVQDIGVQAGSDPGRLSCALPPAVAAGGRADVGGDAGTGGGFPAVPGAVAGDIELVVVQGGGGAPVPGDGAAAGGGGRGAFGAGAFGGALVPPGFVEVGDGVAEVRADGAGLAADELAGWSCR